MNATPLSNAMNTPLNWRRDVELAGLTTMEVGGRAQYFCETRSLEALRTSIRRAVDEGLSLTPLGGGSNVVISDRGIRGVVLIQRDSAINVTQNGSKTRVYATAATPWDELVRFSVEHDLVGLECLSGIPGMVGAAPIQNIGAYGHELAECVTAVDAVDRINAEPLRFSRAQCEFDYRTSVFKSGLRDRVIVTGIELELEAGADPELRYPELMNRFSNKHPSAAQVREKVLEIRRSKSMVWDPSDSNHRSAGSFFLNPIVELPRYERVGQITGTTPPGFRIDERRIKIPAAWLIERAGFSRGMIRGRVGLSSAHALALINRGGARADELLCFARDIQGKVSARFGIDLHPEPVYLGFTDRD
ncbi:MAG: UDP-N-acetylmuramate dehydrogenase [Myxococcota bacterium]